jgi:DNA-binding FrmR family transcriptional regulator
MDNEKKPCCCCGTPAQPEAATAPAVDASAVPTESVTPSCCRHKDRTPEEHKALLNRLSRIEGQVRGIRGMVENSAYCPDILTQVAATSAALNAFTKELLASHIRTCVAEDIRAGHDEAIDELVQTLQKLMK